MSAISAWPYGFWDELWYLEKEVTPNPFENDTILAATIEYVIVIAPLTDRERAILYDRYKNKLSLSKIGQINAISSSRVNQIIHRSIRRIRNNKNCFGLLTQSLDSYIQKCAEEIYAERFAEEFESKRAAITDEANKNAKNYWKYQYEKQYGALITENASLETLHLSSRAIRRLNSAGYSTIRDILTIKSKRKLLQISGFGKTCLNELIHALESRGFDAGRLYL